MTSSTSWRRGVAAITILLLAAACGGGNGSTVTTANPNPDNPPSSSDTGKVGIMFTDGPTDRFDEAIADVRRIELLGDSGNAVIFSSETGEEIDLLALQSFTEIFAIAEEVPAGDYGKIRLILDSLTLKDVENGGIVETAEVNLPGNGKVDLNPRQTIFVAPGTTLIIELDVDVGKSVRIVGAGNSGRYQFRPVIFVNVSEQDAGSKLARVFGTVDSVPDDDSFVLCQERRVSGNGNSEDTGNATCMTVDVDADGQGEDTGVFREDGTWIESPVPLTLQPGDPLIAIGDLSVADEGSPEELILDAYVLELGELGNFARLRGSVIAAYDESVAGESDYGINASRRGTGTVLEGDILGGTRVFSKSAEPMTPSDLVLGITGHFDGVLTPDDTDPTGLRTALVVIDPDASEQITGEIATIDTAAGTLSLVDGTTVCVASDTYILEVELTDDETLSTVVGLADLSTGAPAGIFGEDRTTESEACFVAEIITVEVDNREAPIADAGPDQTVAAGTSVSLDGTGSTDPDGDDAALSFNWTLTSSPAGSGATLDDASNATPGFTADIAGDYTVELEVTDPDGNTGTDSVTITAE